MKLGELGRKKGQKQHPVVSEIRQVKKAVRGSSR
jgi:hypothetical protein